MNALRMIVCCALLGWLAADAQAQSGIYGAPDAISWNQQNTATAPAGVTRTAYVSTADGSVSPNAVQPQGDNSALSPMLSEPGPVSPSNAMPVPPGMAPSGTVIPPGGYIQDAGNCDNCGGCGCGGNGCGFGCGNGCCSPWYASVDFLYMTRDKPNKVYTSAEASSVVNQGSFNDVGWAWGAQTTVGYRFGCNCDWALEGTYWGLAQANTDGGPGIPCPYVTPMTMGLTNLLGTTSGGTAGGCGTANQWTDGSPDHHIWRSWEVDDVEGNLVKNLCGGPCSRVNVDFLTGIRWFHFRDGFVFGAERCADGSQYAGGWLYLNDHISNDLVGLQTGFNASYRFADCWKAFVRPEFGIYDNHMTLDYNLYAVNPTTGQQYQGSSSTYSNPNYPVHASTDGFSFLTQVDVGLDWQITRHLSVNGGYRVVAATGIGLADNQIPFYGNDTQSIADIKRNGDLVLGGAFGGLTFTW